MLGWCGFTFAHGMNNTEMIIAANFGGNNNITLYNYYSVGAELPTQDTGIVGWNVLNSSNSSGIFVNFTRPFNTGQKNDLVFSYEFKTAFSYAYYLEKTSELVHHDSAFEGNIVFGSTNGTSSFTPINNPNPPEPNNDFGLFLSLQGC